MTMEQKFQGKYLLGIDLGGTNIKGAVIDLQGRIIERAETPTYVEQGAEGVAQRITELARELQRASGVTLENILGLGMGVPGQIDCSRGCVLRSGNLGWQEVYIVKLVSQELQLPVFVENDATAAALGEQWLGAGRGSRNCLMLTIGTGIGGGIIIDGRVYRGTSGFGGEIGHMVIQADGPQCSCGKIGCLEALTAAPAILRRAKEAVSNGEETLLRDKERLDVRDIFAAADSGDRVALKAVDETAYYLGIGVGSLINIFNPEVVIVGGGVSLGGETLFVPLRKYAAEHSLPAPWEAARIVPAQLGNNAGFLGAAAIALQGLGMEIHD